MVKMDVGLENGVDRDLPIYGIIQSFYSVYLSRFSRDHVVTLEEKTMGVDKCRVRVWERTNSNCSFNLLFSQVFIPTIYVYIYSIYLGDEYSCCRCIPWALNGFQSHVSSHRF